MFVIDIDRDRRPLALDDARRGGHRDRERIVKVKISDLALLE